MVSIISKERKRGKEPTVTGASDANVSGEHQRSHREDQVKHVASAVLGQDLELAHKVKTQDGHGSKSMRRVARSFCLKSV